MARFSAGTILVGITAVLFGLLGAYVVRKELGRVPDEKKVAEEKAKSTVVPIAAADIPAGRQLTLGDIGLLKLTPEQMKKTGYDKRAFMNNTKQIIGRTLKQGLKKGETFEANIFYPEGTGPSLADKLQPGFRAVTIAVEDVGAVAGLATPGTIVDVFFRSSADAAEDLPELTMPLVEAVEVLALNKETTVGKQIDTTKTRSRDKFSVTLAVRPEHAAALQVAEGHGKLSLALRNGAADASDSTQTVRTLEELLNRPVGKHRIEVYRGRSMSQVEFKRADRLTPTREPAIVSSKPAGVSVNAPAPAAPSNVPETEDQE